MRLSTKHTVTSPRSRGQILAAEVMVQIYTPSARAHGEARKWVRNRNVHVLVVTADGYPVRSIRSAAIVADYTIATEVDARYDGPRSAYGRAVRRADRLAGRLERGLAC